MDIKGYIFDFGGTLDTAGVHWGKAVWHAYERHGVNVGETAFREAYVQVERRLGREDIIRPDFTFFQTLDVKLSLQFDYLKEKKYLCTRNAEISPRALVEDLYQRVAANVRHSADVLAELGKKATLALVSNFYGNLETVLHEFALAPLFQSVTESAQVGLRKPDSRIFSLALEAMGMEACEVAVVGDSLKNDIRPAHELGCTTIWLKGEGWNDDETAEGQADRVISDLTELLSCNISPKGTLYRI